VCACHVEVCDNSCWTCTVLGCSRCFTETVLDLCVRNLGDEIWYLCISDVNLMGNVVIDRFALGSSPYGPDAPRPFGSLCSVI